MVESDVEGGQAFDASDDEELVRSCCNMEELLDQVDQIAVVGHWPDSCRSEPQSRRRKYRV